jgi:hypothetical protein
MEERQDPADDLGGEAGIEQSADLLDPVDVRGVVGAVPVADPLGVQQVLLLVVPEHPGRDTRVAGKLAYAHNHSISWGDPRPGWPFGRI